MHEIAGRFIRTNPLDVAVESSKEGSTARAVLTLEIVRCNKHNCNLISGKIVPSAGLGPSRKANVVVGIVQLPNGVLGVKRVLGCGN